MLFLSLTTHTRLIVTTQKHALQTSVRQRIQTKGSGRRTRVYSNLHTWTKKGTCNYILRTRMNSNTTIRARKHSHALKSRRHGMNHQSDSANTYTRSSLLDSPPVLLGCILLHLQVVSFLFIMPLQVGGTRFGC